jgi:type II secretory pathway component PulF
MSGVASVTFRQIYSQHTSAIPLVQEVIGNVIKNGKNRFNLVVVVVVVVVIIIVVVNRLMPCTQWAKMNSNW